MFKTMVLTRHPSHKILRTDLPKLPVRAVVRLGSTTELKDGKQRIEINAVNAIKISSNKRLMKEQFDLAKCPTAEWSTAKNVDAVLALLADERLRFPIVAKNVYGSRGKGNSLLNSRADLITWAQNRSFENYIFENFMNYMLEYRLHITKGGCFYACRKALKKDTQERERWHRHIDNSVWLLETNPEFHKPKSWDLIVESCVKALTQIGADVLSFDVRVQSPMDSEGRTRKQQNFILIECNSASSFGNPTGNGPSIVSQRYLEMIPQLIKAKQEGLYV